MTVQLSPHKVSKILRDYFRGLPQTKIAKGAAVDQSSISHYASRFKKMTAEVGILAAGKEYQVLNEVESLRSLSVELYKSKLTADEARQGHNIIKAFQKLGISPEKYLTLIEVCQEVSDPGFIEAALRLSQIEIKTGMSYHQVISSFEEAQNQLPQLEERIAEAKAEMKSINDGLLKNKQELLAKMKQLEVEKKEVEQVAILKAELTKKGLKLQTILKLAKEF